jgi:ubiquinol-cytochrome c reductase cytochrome b subunit
MMPPLEIHIGDATIVPNPFFGGLLFPTAVFMALYAWPWIGRRWLGDGPFKHNVLDRPRDNPKRTAAALAFLTMVFTVFAAGAADRVYLIAEIPYSGQVWFFRALTLIAPVIVYFVVKRVCEELRSRDDHPLEGDRSRTIRRNASGGWEAVSDD